MDILKQNQERQPDCCLRHEHRKMKDDQAENPSGREIITIVDLLRLVHSILNKIASVIKPDS